MKKDKDEDEDEDEDEVVVYDIATLLYQYYQSHFLSICYNPDFRDKATDMPSPFILPNKTDHNMPIAVRLWEGKLKSLMNIKNLWKKV